MAAVTIDKGPRREGETDGPREAHIILVDNGRHEVLGTPFAEMMRCMRCGACLNTCPVYRHITGHGYGSIYPGPMGIVLTPALEGYEAAAQLPYACTLCGACDDVCPSRIPLHSLVLEHRNNIVAGGYNSPIERTVYRSAAQMMGHMPLYRIGTSKVAAYGMKALALGGDSLQTQTNWMPVVKGWTGSRDVDNMKTQQFRDWFAKTHGGQSAAQASEYITAERSNAPERGDA